MRSHLRRFRLPLVIAGLLLVAVIGLTTGQRGTPDRAHALAGQLRCPVCKSVSVADSPSETGAAMRREISTQVAQGRSDQQILDYFRDRYGDWVVIGAPPRGDTLPLWLLMAVAVMLAAGLLVLRRRRTREAPEPSELTEVDRLRLARATAALRQSDDERDEP